MALSLMLITGQSGSGKSTVLRALEDQGYTCIDNLPVSLVEQLVRVLHAEGAVEHVALGMDARDRRFVEQGPALVTRLRRDGTLARVIYLDAREEVLLRRYSQTRRRHPLDDGCGLRQAIGRERDILEPMRELADETLDTTAMSPHELRARTVERLVGSEGREGLRLALLSFGFKHGLPPEADIVLDVRFLPNPYFEEAMRERTGLDDDVSHYALSTEQGEAFLERAHSFLAYLVPQYQREGKRYLTVAVGCTGGRHRSVAVARELGRRMGSLVAVDLRHRDLGESKS